MPTKTTGTTNTDTSSESDTYTEGVNESKSQSISRNIVNKHIEAIAEQLYYHSKRFEVGKAIGLWTVGTYILAENESDAESGALQLRSIMSGQESSYEPIRLHCITDIVSQNVDGKSLMQSSFGQLTEPRLEIYGAGGRRFLHPWGEHFMELKSVLTTKELSYLINFPLKSVPGISVVDSSPEFSLNKPTLGSDRPSIQFGNRLLGQTYTAFGNQWKRKNKYGSSHT